MQCREMTRMQILILFCLRLFPGIFLNQQPTQTQQPGGFFLEGQQPYATQRYPRPGVPATTTREQCEEQQQPAENVCVLSQEEAQSE